MVIDINTSETDIPESLQPFTIDIAALEETPDGPKIAGLDHSWDQTDEILERMKLVSYDG